MADRDWLVEIVVEGKPVGQGSMQAYVPLHPRTKQPYRRKGGDGVVVTVKASNDGELKAFRDLVARTARSQMRSRPPVAGRSLVLDYQAWLYRAQGDWGTGRNAHLLKDGAPALPQGAPDVDKLLRAAFDALTGVVYADDCLVADARTRKWFAVPDETGDRLRVEIRVGLHELQAATDLPLSERRRVPPARRGDDGEPTLALAV